MNSTLYSNEEGRVPAGSFVACDSGLTTHFTLPSVSIEAAELFLLARKTAPSTPALSVVVGDKTYHVDTSPSDYAGWLQLSVHPSSLHAGENTVTVPAQPGWAVAFEPASGMPVIRLRVADGRTQDAPVLPTYGDPAIEPDRDEWLALLPASLRTISDRWEWCWNVAGFLSSAWTYANESDGTSYAPWDTRVILQWGRAGRDDRGEKPIAMCVHYGVSLVQFCIAMGVPARAVALTPGLNLMSGHFVAEVWLDEYQMWAMVDANMHLCYKDHETGRPLSVAELTGCGSELRQLAQFGPGWQSHCARFEAIVQEDYLSGAVYRLWGVWRRHNWVERPDLAPPAHGALVYCETDILWCAEDDATRAELAMFPHHLSAAQLAVAPQGGSS